MGKGKKRKQQQRRGASLEEVFGAGASVAPDGGWRTSLKDVMMQLDDGSDDRAGDGVQGELATGLDAKENEMEYVAAATAKALSSKNQGRAARAPKAMDTSDATTSTAQPGVVKQSMKRGDRTKTQKLRKAMRLSKAVARADKLGVRMESSKARSHNKLNLKHMY